MKIRLLYPYAKMPAGTVVDWSKRVCDKLIKDKHAECVDECDGCDCEPKARKRARTSNKAVQE